MKQTPGTYPDAPGGLTCTLCNTHFRLPELVDHFAPTKPKKKALLEKIGKMRPQLKRFTAAEYGKARAVATTTNEALAGVIPAVHDCKARLVLIEAPTLEIAKQVVTQSGDQLPWCENVSLTKTGTLADLLWHGAFTARERQQLETRL